MHPWDILEECRKYLNEEKNMNAVIVIDRLQHGDRFPVYPKPGVFISPGNYTAGNEDTGRIGAFDFKVYIHRDSKISVEGDKDLKEFKEDIKKVINAIVGKGSTITTGGIQLKSFRAYLEQAGDNNFFHICEVDFAVDCSLD